MTEEVTDCNSYEALRLQFSCDNVNIGNGTGWGGKRYCIGAPYNTDDGLRSIAFSLIFFNEKVHSTGEATHADRFSYTVQQAKISDIHVYMPRRAYSLLNTTLSMSLAYLPGSNNLKLLIPSVKPVVSHPEVLPDSNE